MGKSTLTIITKNIQTVIKKHSPEILIVIGIAGMITTTVIAVKATPKALILIDEKKKENDEDKLSPVEVIKTTWTCYIPAAVTVVISISCLVGARSVNIRRNAALATAYTLTESALKEYKEKVIETIGEKKEQAARDAIAKDKIVKDPVSNRDIIVTDKGNVIIFALSRPIFKKTKWTYGQQRLL